MAYFRSHVLVSVDPLCVVKGAYDLIEAFQDELVKQGLVEEVEVLETSRIGNPASEGPDLMVYPEAVHYTNLKSEDIPFLCFDGFSVNCEFYHVSGTPLLLILIDLINPAAAHSANARGTNF